MHYLFYTPCIFWILLFLLLMHDLWKPCCASSKLSFWWSIYLYKNLGSEWVHLNHVRSITGLSSDFNQVLNCKDETIDQIKFWIWLPSGHHSSVVYIGESFDSDHLEDQVGCTALIIIDIFFSNQVKSAIIKCRSQRKVFLWI